MSTQLNVSSIDNREHAIRKTTILFASLFKDIPFIKYDDVSGNELEHFKVPIIYSNKEKYVKRLDIASEKVQITLPRIEYGLVNMQYDPSRRTNQANKIVGCSSNATSFVNSPLPYNFNFEIILYTRNIEDANQIMEYIIPFFYPDYNIKINIIPTLGIIKNIPITFNGESEEEDSTGSFDEPVRSVFRTLSFTARSYIYPPSRIFKPILWANTNIYLSQDTTKITFSSGNGTFIIGETVFQGDAFDRADSKATVNSWHYLDKLLEVNPIYGTFIANTHVMNVGKTADYIVSSVGGSGLVLNTTVTPVPNTYPAVLPFSYNIVETDYTQ